MVSRDVIRYASAAVSAAVAIVYFLIALGAITVVSTAPQPGDWVIPGAAGAAFAVLALFLLVTQKRVVFVLGAAMSILAIVGYFVVAPHRTPSVEIWGILIKAAQTVLVVALGYLFFGPAEAGAGRRQLT